MTIWEPVFKKVDELDETRDYTVTFTGFELKMIADGLHEVAHMQIVEKMLDQLAEDMV